MRTHILFFQNYPFCCNATFRPQADRDSQTDSGPTPNFRIACREEHYGGTHFIDAGTVVPSFYSEDGAGDESAENEVDAVAQANDTNTREQQQQEQEQEQHWSPRLRGGEGDSEDEGYNNSSFSSPFLSSPEEDENDSDYSGNEGDGNESNPPGYFEEEMCPNCLASSRAALEAYVCEVRNLLVRHGWTELADVQARDVVTNIRRRWEREMALRRRDAAMERERRRGWRDRDMEVMWRWREGEREREREAELEDDDEGEGGDDDYWDEDDAAGEGWDDEDDGEVTMFVFDEDDDDADLEEGRRRGMARLRGGEERDEVVNIF